MRLREGWSGDEIEKNGAVPAQTRDRPAIGIFETQEHSFAERKATMGGRSSSPFVLRKFLAPTLTRGGGLILCSLRGGSSIRELFKARPRGLLSLSPFAPRKSALITCIGRRSIRSRSERRQWATADRLPTPESSLRITRGSALPFVTFVALCSNYVRTCQSNSRPARPRGTENETASCQEGSRNVLSCTHPACTPSLAGGVVPTPRTNSTRAVAGRGQIPNLEQKVTKDTKESEIR